jgi:predicted deacylase
MPTIYESMDWKRAPIGAAAASGTMDLQWGEVGDAGPRVLLIAGTHGDEGPWSALAIRDALEHGVGRLRGRLTFVFTADPLAASTNARNASIDATNCVDIDGTFPGNPGGSHTERIAAVLAPLIANSDVILDLHGGGSWCVNAFTKVFDGSESLARAFGAPFHRIAPNKPGGLTTYARSEGARVVNVEVGGRGKNEGAWQSRITAGILRVLHAEGVLELEAVPDPAPEGLAVGPTQAIRAEVGGIFVPAVGEDAVGTLVAGDTTLGQILDLATLAERQTVRAPFARTALMLLRPHICVVHAGDILYALAAPEEDA